MDNKKPSAQFSDVDLDDDYSLYMVDQPLDKRLKPAPGASKISDDAHKKYESRLAHIQSVNNKLFASNTETSARFKESNALHREMRDQLERNFMDLKKVCSKWSKDHAALFHLFQAIVKQQDELIRQRDETKSHQDNTDANTKNYVYYLNWKLGYTAVFCITSGMVGGGLLVGLKVAGIAGATTTALLAWPTTFTIVMVTGLGVILISGVGMIYYHCEKNHASSAKKKDQTLVDKSYAQEKVLSKTQWDNFKGMWQAFVQSTPQTPNGKKVDIRNGDASTYGALTTENGAVCPNALEIIRARTSPCVPTNKKKTNFFSFFNF